MPTQKLAKLRIAKATTVDGVTAYESRRMRIDWPRHVFPAMRDRIRAHLSRISGRFIEHAQTNSCGVTARSSAVACWHSFLYTEKNNLAKRSFLRPTHFYIENSLAELSDADHQITVFQKNKLKSQNSKSRSFSCQAVKANDVA